MPPIPGVPWSYCWSCKKKKPYYCFFLKGDKPYSYCKDCNKIKCSKYHNERTDIKHHVKLPAAPKGLKRCQRCKECKEPESFHRNKRKKDGRDGYCKQYAKELHPNSYFKHKYGITEEQYNIMLEQQGGVCAICKQPETIIHLGKDLRLSVDHNHTTKTIRQLLCYRCNHLIGYLERNKGAILEAALDYLQRHST